MNEAELLNLPPKGDVRASIEASQRRRPAPPAGEPAPPAGEPAPPAGEIHAMRFTPTGYIYVDVEGREVQPTPDPAWQQRIARERAESDAREAFELAVVDDFAASAQLYVVWWNAHLDAGGRGLAPFAESIQTVLVNAARVRREAP